MTVHDVVERERSRALRLTVLTAAGAAVATTLLLLAAGAALLGGSRWLQLPRELPLVLWLVIGACNAAIIWHARRRARATTPASVAGTIERDQALRAGTVRGALEVGAAGALGRRAAAAVADTLGARGPVLAPTLRRTNRHRAAGALAAAVVASAAAIAVAPVFGDGLLAVLKPTSAYDGSLVPRLHFRGLPSDLLRGERLTIAVSAPGRSHVRILHRTAGAGWQSRDVPVRNGVAELDAGDMRSTTHVMATDGRTATDTMQVTLAERPFIGATTMRAVYPAYLGRPAETLPGSGRIEVPRGTVLSFAGRSSVSLDSVRLVSGAARIELRPHGHTFEGRHVAAASATWEWAASSPHAAVDVPEPLHLDVTPDSAPIVDLLLPAADTAIAPGETIGLRIGAGDDHGLANVMVEVVIERGSGRAAPVRRLVASRPGASWDGPAEVDAAAVGGREGDVLHVRALATDVSPWAQLGASRTLRVRLRTSEERREHARTLGDSVAATAGAIARAQRELAQRTDAASRSRDRSSATSPAEAPAAGGAADASPPPQATMSQEASERARTIAQEQRQLAERVDALRDAAAELEKGLREAGALDSSLARQLQEAQELMRQAMSPELMARMQQLEQAAQSLDGDKARAAMRDLAEMQRQLREQLEQSAEIIKRAAHEGAMQTLSDEARELARRQRALGDSAQARPDAAREAERLADRSDRYADAVQELQKRLAADRAQAAAEGTSEARDAARRAEERLRAAAPEAAPRRGAQQSSGQQQAGQPQAGQQQAGQQQAGQPQAGQPQAGQPQASAAQRQQVAQGAREAASQMDRAADAMQEARDAQVKEWKQELTAELDRAVQETLQMAREERALAQQSRSGAASPQEMRSRQGAVQQGVDKTGDRLGEAGRRSALLSGGAQRAMAEAREKVQAATREMTQGGQSAPGRATQGQADALEEAAESLNRAAASLARDRERANSASSASGFAEMMQQLQEMAQRQGSINGQAQSLMQMPGGQQSPQGAQMARALARQQRQVAQQLDDISAEAGGGRTGELAREARQLADALDAGRLDTRTAARQEQLFKRLLDAGRALEKEEREDTDRREARAARDGATHAPGAAGARGRDARQFREPTWEELRGLSAEERRAIIEYFRRINAETRP